MHEVGIDAVDKVAGRVSAAVVAEVRVSPGDDRKMLTRRLERRLGRAHRP